MLVLGVGLLGAYFGVRGQEARAPWPPPPIVPPEPAAAEESENIPASASEKFAPAPPKPVVPPDIDLPLPPGGDTIPAGAFSNPKGPKDESNKPGNFATEPPLPAAPLPPAPTPPAQMPP